MRIASVYSTLSDVSFSCLLSKPSVRSLLSAVYVERIRNLSADRRREYHHFT